jgi:hypothetical protein
MTPEEQAVLRAAKRMARAINQQFEIKRLIAEADLLLAVQALKISQQPEHTVAALPCGEPSASGTMFCELPAGHAPDETLTWHELGLEADGNRWQYAYRPHAGRAKNGSYRRWELWVERKVG